MDEKTIVALTELATKLGTTAEYLWSVLVKQAAVEAWIDMGLLTLLTVGTGWWVSWVHKNTTIPERKAVDRYLSAHWDSDACGVAWVGTMALVIVVLLVEINLIPQMFTAFINPEYWALDQIMNR